MFKIRILALLLATNLIANGQSTHFIAIQSADKKPFYVKIDANVFNSSATGHLIISSLSTKTYLLVFGIPKTNIAEVQFAIPVTKDVGFIFRNTREKGLVLSNSQTGLAIAPVRQQQFFVSADSSTMAVNSPITKKTDESFSKLMAEVVNDSAVMENMEVSEAPNTPLAKTAPTQSETAKSVIAKNDVPKNDIAKNEISNSIPSNSDTLSIKNKNRKSEDTILKRVATIKTQEKKEKLLQSRSQKSLVKKLSERNTGAAEELVFEDNLISGLRDTINIEIPIDSNYVTNLTMRLTNDSPGTDKPLAAASELPYKGKKDSSSLSVNKNPIASKDTAGNLLEGAAKIPKNIPTLSDHKPAKESIVQDSSKNYSSQTPLYRPITVNSNCKNYASDYDVDKLRIKMLAIEDEDDRISTAKKVFKAKCFATSQIKALSEVFVTDGGKYKLFDAAYSYVSDVNNFTVLESLLKDQYFISRFKAMIRP